MTSRNECFVVLDPFNHAWLIVKAAKERGLRTVVIHTAALTPSPPYDVGLRYMDASHQIADWRDACAVADEIERVVGRGAIIGTYACLEHTLLSNAILRERRRLPGLSPEDTPRILDKLYVREVLSRSGMTQVATYSVDEVKGWTDWADKPSLFFKPRYGGGSMLVARVESREQLESALQRWDSKDEILFEDDRSYIESGPGPFLETALVGELVSVESFVFNGEPFILGGTSRTVLSRNPIVEMGLSFPYPKAETRRVCEYVKKVHTALGFSHGATHVELIINASGEPDLVEFNARLGGSDLFIAMSYVYGPHLANSIIDLGLGTEFTPPVRPAIHRFAVMQNILPPDTIDTFQDINVDPIVDFLRISQVPSTRLASRRNQIDQIGTFIVVAATYEEALGRAAAVRRSIKINGVSVNGDPNNVVNLR